MAGPSNTPISRANCGSAMAYLCTTGRSSCLGLRKFIATSTTMSVAMTVATMVQITGLRLQRSAIACPGQIRRLRTIPGRAHALHALGEGRSESVQPASLVPFRCRQLGRELRRDARDLRPVDLVELVRVEVALGVLLVHA